MDQEKNADQEPNPTRNLINDFEAEDPVEDLTALIENINIQDESESEESEEEIDNLSAEGNRDKSTLKIAGEGIVMEEIQEGDEKEEDEKEREVGEAVLRLLGSIAGASWGLVWAILGPTREHCPSACMSDSSCKLT